MHFQIQNLDRSTSSRLEAECRDCGWWQGHDDGWPSRDAANAWEESAAEQFDFWGKLAIGDDRMLGFIQFGPADLFERAGSIAGEEAKGSFLLACSKVAGDDVTSLRKSLLICALSELRLLEVEHIDAFCSSLDDAGDECRLFSRDFLDECGFYPVKSAGELVMMRLELGGMQPMRPIKKRTRHRLLERIKRRPATAPSPAAMCRKRKLRKPGTVVGS